MFAPYLRPYPAHLFQPGGLDVAQFVVLTEWQNYAGLNTSDGTPFTNATRQTANPPGPGEAYIQGSGAGAQVDILSLIGLTPGSIITITAMVISQSGGGTFLYVGSGDVIQSMFPMSAVGGVPSINGELPQATWRNAYAALAVAPDGVVRLRSVFAAAIARMTISIAVPAP